MLVENVEQQEGKSHSCGTANNGHHTAIEHPVDILGGCHGYHNRDVHLFPKVHTLNEVRLLGKGEFFAVGHKKQQQDSKTYTAHIGIDANQRAKAGADVLAQQHTKRQGH